MNIHHTQVHGPIGLFHHDLSLLDPEFDEVAGEDTETETLPMFIRGGLLHRFADDEAISAYCDDNYLDEPIIHGDGKVTAYCDYHHDRVQIGWVI